MLSAICTNQPYVQINLMFQIQGEASGAGNVPRYGGVLGTLTGIVKNEGPRYAF
jgi:hypothetical protein